MADDFWKKYKHPKWQAKRLEVMERAGFRCERCSDADEQLHVHHTYYQKNTDPWEYPDDALLCLCEGCHARAHALRDEMKDLIAQLSRGENLHHNYPRLLGYARALVGDAEGAVIRIAGGGELMGVADYFKVDRRQLLKMEFTAEEIREIARSHPA